VATGREVEGKILPFTGAKGFHKAMKGSKSRCGPHVADLLNATCRRKGFHLHVQVDCRFGKRRGSLRVLQKQNRRGL